MSDQSLPDKIDEVVYIWEISEERMGVVAKNTFIGCYLGYTQTVLSEEELDKRSLGVEITYGPDEDGWIGFDTGHAWCHNVDEMGEPLQGVLQDVPKIGGWSSDLQKKFDADEVREVVESLAQKLDKEEAQL